MVTLTTTTLKPPCVNAVAGQKIIKDVEFRLQLHTIIEPLLQIRCTGKMYKLLAVCNAENTQERSKQLKTTNVLHGSSQFNTAFNEVSKLFNPLN